MPSNPNSRVSGPRVPTAKPPLPPHSQASQVSQAQAAEAPSKAGLSAQEALAALGPEDAALAPKEALETALRAVDAEIALEIATPPKEPREGAPGTANDAISVETATEGEVYLANTWAQGKAPLQDKLRGCVVNSSGLVETNWPGLEDSGQEMDSDALDWNREGRKAAQKITRDDPGWRLAVPGYGDAVRDVWQAGENLQHGEISAHEAETAKELARHRMGGPGSQRALDQRVAALGAALVAAKKAVQDLLDEALEKTEPPDDTRYGRTWLVVWDVQSPAAAERLKTDTRTALVVLPTSIPMIARGSDLLLVKPVDAVREGLDVDDLTMEVLREHGLGPFVTKLIRDPLNITERQRAFWGPAATSRGKVYWGVPLPHSATMRGPQSD